MKRDAIHIRQAPPRTTYINVVLVVNTTQIPDRATDLERPFIVGDGSKKTQHDQYHSISVSHTFLCAKFEGEFSISFTRTLMSRKSGTLSKGTVHPFF